jgi:hypothetical protein
LPPKRVLADAKIIIFEQGFGKYTGFGLFLSREILSITGITITENGIPGKGARFEITMPKGEYRFAGTNNEKYVCLSHPPGDIPPSPP